MLWQQGDLMPHQVQVMLGSKLLGEECLKSILIDEPRTPQCTIHFFKKHETLLEEKGCLSQLIADQLKKKQQAQFNKRE